MAASSPPALRWRLLKRSLLRSKSDEIDEEAARVSRVPSGSFGLIASRCVEDNEEIDGILWEYTLPDERTTALLMRQSRSGQFKLSDHSSCRELGIDNTGVICLWPAEEILAYYCVSRPEMFRNKRIIELGAGYGLAGLALAACTDPAEVLITDGNPKISRKIAD
ncbi:calmodulin-lysine N-methyltransferase [Selaginella moellendorffii]|uniref:calmodulin-lysine N-methyltransferase n=1 Tax=Selaginella moellendorffii TaxID=88036 RepID=UPI000D1CA55D|nr:calmodulin-lysine N-methyltransferase [Selaginella moellendorffii]|eukprot:XP_024516595.1 calmodulin-lysine N-methyltransferase [Selaginella moellendorffii]